MSAPRGQSYRSIHDAILRRIHDGEWPPGGLMPSELDLAAAFGCSRTTVNRALQLLAANGVVERRRRAGTRVVPTPIRRATLEIPIIRHEVEGRGATYRHTVLKCEKRAIPKSLAVRLNLPCDAAMLYLTTLHLADEAPYMYEERWVNIAAAPGIMDAPLKDISANEWLVREIPYSSGDITFSATDASLPAARFLDISPGAPVFLVERTAWLDRMPITSLRMNYPRGYKIRTRL